MNHFPARLDSLARTLSFVVVVALIIPFSSIFTQYDKLNDTWLLIGPSIVVLVLGGAALLRPKGYDLDGSFLRIITPVRKIQIPLNNIRSIGSITPKELGFGLRVFGSGGFLGYFGRYYYGDRGWIQLYVTDRSKMLLLTLQDDRKILISPDDTEGFMNAFRNLNR